MQVWCGVSYPGQDHFQRAISQGMKLLGSATCILRTQPNHHCIKFQIKNIAHSLLRSKYSDNKTQNQNQSKI